MGLQLALAGADIRAVRADHAAAAAHILTLFINGDILAGHTRVVHEECSSRQTGDAAADNVCLAVLNAFGLAGMIQKIIQLHRFPSCS